MKFNLHNLENKLKNITEQSVSIDNAIKNTNNKKKIETIMCLFFSFIYYDFNLQKKKYLDFISRFSINYLIGDKIYNEIGENYTFDYYFNNLDRNLQIKIYKFMFFMCLMYSSI